MLSRGRHILFRIKQESRWRTNSMLFRLGLGKRKLAQRPGASLLLYHGITTRDPFRFNARFLHVSEFEKHLSYFKENFHVVSLKEYSEGKRHPTKYTLAITFDDGYRNNLDLALPLLEKYRLPATFFITAVSLKDRDILWPDLVDISAHFAEKPLQVSGEIFVVNRNKEWIHSASGVKLKTLMNSSAKFPLEILMDSLSEYNGFRAMKECDEFWKLLNREEIYTLSRSGLAEIGSHGISHMNLGMLSEDIAHWEIKRSKEWLEEITGRSVVSWAYPGGSWNNDLLKWIKDSGYNIQLLMDPVDSSNIDQFNVFPRLTINPFISVENLVAEIYRGNFYQ